MDALELLRKDHRKVETLFRRFNDRGGLTGVVKRLTGTAASPRQKRSTAQQVCRELDVHAAIEESTFYPASAHSATSGWTRSWTSPCGSTVRSRTGCRRRAPRSRTTPGSARR
jgi:hypothetical protein